MGSNLPDFDLHLPLMSLPCAFGTESGSIPNRVPYLLAEIAKAEYFKQRLVDLPRGLKVGLMWAGNRKPDPKRTCPLIEFAPLAEIQGVHFISLQKDTAAADLQTVPHGLSVTDFAPDIKIICRHRSFAGESGPAADDRHRLCALARLCENMDAAAALCRLCGPCDRSDSPWYPTMRSFW